MSLFSVTISYFVFFCLCNSPRNKVRITVQVWKDLDSRVLCCMYSAYLTVSQCEPSCCYATLLHCVRKALLFFLFYFILPCFEALSCRDGIKILKQSRNNKAKTYSRDNRPFVYFKAAITDRDGAGCGSLIVRISQPFPVYAILFFCSNTSHIHILYFSLCFCMTTGFAIIIVFF